MHQILIAAFVSALFSQGSTPTREALVLAALIEWRAEHLRDTTAVSVCEVREAFDTAGNVFALIAKQSRWSTKRACDALVPGAAYVGTFVRAVRFRGDSATVYIGRRAANHGYTDEYVIVKRPDRFVVERYSITSYYTSTPVGTRPE